MNSGHNSAQNNHITNDTNNIKKTKEPFLDHCPNLPDSHSFIDDQLEENIENKALIEDFKNLFYRKQGKSRTDHLANDNLDKFFQSSLNNPMSTSKPDDDFNSSNVYNAHEIFIRNAQKFNSFQNLPFLKLLSLEESKRPSKQLIPAEFQAFGKTK